MQTHPPFLALLAALLPTAWGYAQPAAPESKSAVQSGMEALLARHLPELEGRSVGIVCNHTAVDAEGRHLVDRLLEHPRIRIRAIFTPEHGYRGDVPDGGDAPAGTDPVSGAVVYALYGARLKPTPAMMEGLDVMLYDIQDVGARFYTYTSTLGYAMQAAAEAGLEFWVLDRPDPIGGTAVEGPLLEAPWRSFVGLYPIPIRYGLTPGELAVMIVGESWLDFPPRFRPRVIRLEGWDRASWYDGTGMRWVSPSPNMPSLSAATVYPGTCLFEGTNVSEGRGTDRPFEWIGAPWIDAAALLKELDRRGPACVAFAPVTFTARLIPGRTAVVKYLGQECRGVEIRVLDRRRFQPMKTAVHILEVILRVHGGSAWLSWTPMCSYLEDIARFIGLTVHHAIPVVP